MPWGIPETWQPLAAASGALPPPPEISWAAGRTMPPGDAPGFAALAVAAARHNGMAVAAALDRIRAPLEQTASVLIRHQIAAMVSAALADTGDPSRQAVRLKELIDRPRQRRYLSEPELLETIDHAQCTLARCGIPAIVLKGPIISVRLYSSLSRRPQADVDLLIPGWARDDAVHALTGDGYEVRRRHLHALDLERGGSQIDLHWALRAAPAYRIDEASVWRSARTLDHGGVRLRGLSNEYLLTLLALSMAEDVGLGMGKLKQMCDLWLLISELGDRFPWSQWLARRQGERVDRLTAGALRMTLDAVGDGAAVPRLQAALRASGEASEVELTQALELIAAPRHNRQGAEWFADRYPGSLLRYRVASLLAGWPDSLSDIQVHRLAGEMGRLARTSSAWKPSAEPSTEVVVSTESVAQSEPLSTDGP